MSDTFQLKIFIRYISTKFLLFQWNFGSRNKTFSYSIFYSSDRAIRKTGWDRMENSSMNYRFIKFQQYFLLYWNWNLYMRKLISIKQVNKKLIQVFAKKTLATVNQIKTYQSLFNYISIFIEEWIYFFKSVISRVEKLE